MSFTAGKIGYASQTITPSRKATRSRSVLLNLNLLGAIQPAMTRLDMEANEEWILERFDFELSSKEIRFAASGSVRGNKLALEVDSGGHKSAHEITLSPAPYLLAALKPYVVTQQLETGKKFFFSTFDPATLSQQVTTVIIEGREQIRVGNRTEPAIKLRQSYRGISVVSWVDGQGRTLKEESPAGLSIVRQSSQEAKNLPSRGMSLDMVAQTAIPVATPDRQCADKTNPTVKTQRRPVWVTCSSPAAASVSTAIDWKSAAKNSGKSAHRSRSRKRVYSPMCSRRRFCSRITRASARSAAQILQGETNALRAALKIKDWVYKEIAKEPTVSIPNALEVLRTKKGDCNEHTVLFNALARAAGIPAKTVVGVVYLRGAFYYHAWSEVWLGEWVSLDSVLNQFPADVTHVKFLEGGIDRQIDILQLIGNLKIEVL